MTRKMDFNTGAYAGALVATMALCASHAHANAPGTCQLGNRIQHVVYIQFDNVHLERDNPNVPSDLEQMPNLLNFLKNQGTLLANHHTPLISHTADDIVTSLTGVYGDRHGVPVANSFGFFNPNGSVSFSSSFGYWTDPLGSTTIPLMVNEVGRVAPAPWVPFTRAGCDVGQVSVANTVLENTGADIIKVFGAGSPEATEASQNSALAQANFVGIGVHCGFGSTLCANSPNARRDVLRNEPGGYAGYLGLFGHKYVAATISPVTPLTDLDGNVITDGKGHNGFPGFDGMAATRSLSYVAKMLEGGIPIVFSYISDAHDNHNAGTAPCPAGQTCAYGPGEAGFVANLQSYDRAFGQFFSRLQADGINASNTLFVVSTEEQDHYAGTRNPTPAGCDGVATPCTYDHTVITGNVGEVSVNLKKLLATTASSATSFSVHSDLAPTYYITGNPGQTAPTTRQLERDVANLSVTNPYTGTTELLNDYVADQAAMKMLHMVTSDSSRTPTFVAFQKGDYFGSVSTGNTSCLGQSVPNGTPVYICPGFAYQHGGYQPEITTAWLGLAGPGVTVSGTDSVTWTDHTDTRPTLLSLVGLLDSYEQDGRVVAEVLQDTALPPAIAGSNRGAYLKLAQAYKQINASVGTLALETLQAATFAVTGNDPGDAQYTSCEVKINQWVQTRNQLAQQMNNLLQGAEFGGQPVDSGTADSLASQAKALIAGATCP